MGVTSPSFWRVVKWLYDAPESREQYYTQAFFSGFSDLYRGYTSARDNTAYMDDYLKNRGLDYGDIKYASRTPGWSGGSALGHGVRSVSRNVESLYTSGVKKKRMNQAQIRRAYYMGRMAGAYSRGQW